MKLITAFLLHHANRSVKDFYFGQYTSQFYWRKDAILREHAQFAGYDIQHIEGKKCYKCNGTGDYDRWDSYGVWDPDICWSCAGTGWYKDPQWNCLQRYKFGPYVFHSPMKREHCVENPFTQESLGWQVSDRPVIQGYVKHESTWFGKYATALLMFGTPYFKPVVVTILKEWRWYLERQIGRVTRLFKKRQKIVCYPYQNDPDSDLPF